MCAVADCVAFALNFLGYGRKWPEPGQVNCDCFERFGRPFERLA